MILGANGKPIKFESRKLRLRATYDSAQTVTQSSRHWAAADALSADTANSYTIRKRIREKARYEIANNSYAKAIVEIYAADVVGTGPRLQLLTENEKLNDDVEARWLEWSSAIGLSRKLRLLHKARVCDGEGFGLAISNSKNKNEIKLDLRIIECDRIHEDALLLDPNNIDGILIDNAGNVIEYRALKYHPGTSGYLFQNEFISYLPQDVIHWYRQDRPEQHRGISEMQSVLELFAQLRRYILATLSAAETAADIAAMLHTEAPASGESDDLEPLESIEFERNMLLTLPAGWNISQIKAEHPPAQFQEFIREILKQIARCVSMPLNLAVGDSSDSNFASGRLDHQGYENSIRITQFDLGEVAADPLYEHWLKEASLAYHWDVTPKVDHIWMWDGPNYTVNPLQESKAEDTQLLNHTTTYAERYGRRGLDWRKQLRQKAKELNEMEALGLPIPSQNKNPQGGNGTPDNAPAAAKRMLLGL